LYKRAILADENVHTGIVRALRSEGFLVLSIREESSGIADAQVLERAQALNAILLTEDSDFGELIFSHRIHALGVVYLRYSWRELEAIINALVHVLKTHDLDGSYITISPTKIRERKL
jgi:predicted nuclease of predicted toxin-antitoxin system